MSHNKVLFVDDERNVLNAIRRSVIEESYTAYFAVSVDEALDIMEEHEISVIVTDMRMPVMDGLGLLKIAKQKFPKTIRIVLSGYTQLAQMLATINQGEIFKFIPKPWASEEELLPVIRQGVDYYNLQVERDTLRENLAKRNLAYQNIFRKIEQKTAQEKEEVHNLHKISEFIFSFMRKSITGVVAEEAIQLQTQGQVLDALEQVYLAYLSQLPMTTDSRNLSQLINDLAKACDQPLSFNLESTTDFLVTGNHKLLLMMFKTLIQNIPQKDKKIVCNVTQSATVVGKVEFLFEIKIEPGRFTMHEQNHLRIFCALLNKIGNFYNMKVALECIENEVRSILLICYHIVT